MDLIAFQKLDYEVFESETGTDYIQDTTEFDCVFVLSEFKGEVFDALHKADVRIVGPPVIIRCAKESQVTSFKWLGFRNSVYSIFHTKIWSS